MSDDYDWMSCDDSWGAGYEDYAEEPNSCFLDEYDFTEESNSCFLDEYDFTEESNSCFLDEYDFTEESKSQFLDGSRLATGVGFS
jgi:hypothetical protein